MAEKITGIILAGGKSTRMGTDKAHVEISRKKIISYVFEILTIVTNSIMIISNSDNGNFLNVPVYPDIIKGRGPLGGIYTGLNYSATEKNIFLSCDIPFITVDLLNFLINASNEFEITVPEHKGKIEPLCGVYSKSCSEKIKTILFSDNFKLHDAINMFNSKKMNVENESFYNSKLLANINTPEELKKYTEVANEN